MTHRPLNHREIENAQRMAAHESVRTTKLYDRRNDQVTLDEIERIVLQRKSAKIEGCTPLLWSRYNQTAHFISSS